MTYESARDSGFLNRADFYGFVLSAERRTCRLRASTCRWKLSLLHTFHIKKKKENKIPTHQSGVSQVLPGVPLFLMSLTKLPTSEHSLGVPPRCGFYY